MLILKKANIEDVKNYYHLKNDYSVRIASIISYKNHVN